MESIVKKQLIESVKNIKQKVKRMKDHDEETEIKLKKAYKPIIEPLHSIDASFRKLKYNNGDNIILKEQPDSSLSDYKDFEEDDEDKIKNKSIDYIGTPVKSEFKIPKLNTPCKSWLGEDNLFDTRKSLNIPFGIRSDGDKLMIGNSVVKFGKPEPSDDGITVATIGDKVYEITPGIKEALLKQKPDLNLLSEKDKLVYKDILINTNVHKRDYSPNGQFKGDRSMKYSKLIKPLFVDQTEPAKYGGKLPTLKKYKRNTDLVYWDDPNELIERLKLLVASRDAGNNGHDNEIISIIEELKEAGIIKE